MPTEDRDLEQVDSFLLMVGKDSLLDFYEVTPDTPADVLESRIKARRTWAQAQQANPKYRTMAMWLIKNHGLVRRLLLENLDDYLRASSSRSHRQKLEQLGFFVRGSLIHGVLSVGAETSIHDQGSSMGLAREEVEQFLREEMGIAPRSTEALAAREEDIRQPASFVDVYSVLQVASEASQEQLEAAYRSRYRWARSLKNAEKAATIYTLLEAAWREVSDPDRRRDYDHKRQRILLQIPHDTTESFDLFDDFSANAPSDSVAPASPSASAAPFRIQIEPAGSPVPPALQPRPQPPEPVSATEPQPVSTAPAPPTPAPAPAPRAAQKGILDFERLTSRPALPGATSRPPPRLPKDPEPQKDQKTDPADLSDLPDALRTVVKSLKIEDGPPPARPPGSLTDPGLTRTTRLPAKENPVPSAPPTPRVPYSDADSQTEEHDLSAANLEKSPGEASIPAHEVSLDISRKEKRTSSATPRKPTPPEPPRGLASVIPATAPSQAEQAPTGPSSPSGPVDSVPLVPPPLKDILVGEYQRVRAPRLRVEGPEVLVFRSWLKEREKEVLVIKEGEGSLWVHAQSSQPWLTVEPHEIPADFTRTTLRLRLKPELFEPSHEVARLSLVPQFGDRKLLTVQTERRPPWLGMALVAAALVLALPLLAFLILWR